MKKWSQISNSIYEGHTQFLFRHVLTPIPLILYYKTIFDFSPCTRKCLKERLFVLENNSKTPDTIRSKVDLELARLELLLRLIYLNSIIYTHTCSYSVASGLHKLHYRLQHYTKTAAIAWLQVRFLPESSIIVLHYLPRLKLFLLFSLF